MSTKCVIGLEKNTMFRLYKSCDGNPEAVLPWLEKFNREFTDISGMGAGYKFAELVRSTVTMAEEFNLHNSSDKAWGVFVCELYMGQGYEYILMNDGMIFYQPIR